MSGGFITFEGGDGSGKSTQAQLLAQHLQSRGHDVLLTREPGGCEGAEGIRDLLVKGSVEKWAPASEVLLHTAARYEHVLCVINPALEAGRWVICDRFVDSTRAYQHFGLGVDRDLIEDLHQRVVGGLDADITLLLDAPLNHTLPRANTALATENRVEEGRYESLNRDFHLRVRKGFSELYLEDPNRIRIIDATADIQAVHSHILNEIEAKWPKLAETL